ncbi:Type IV fimbrial biogenesis protein PilX [Cupriavidus sp. U2]|uniref:pilus assembly PilX family protein n=1 Tax=Cupriavidus sp. U2 TaxID=2920269 RepID=UPI00129E9F08|nr:pilus assembly PilX N-terminal domain-containing protein [Cupriavidus sp. U2]KAI3591224.1 Type IV fimbrial biogenesis protein PilX [Cupriavidus sp. U2]
MSPIRHRQHGVTLLITLVFLVVFLMLTISLVGSSVVNTKVAANQQYGVEARHAAQQGIEQVISQDFTAAPVARTVPVDVTGDGKADYTVQVAAPVCETSKPVKNIELDENNADDVSCFVGNGNNNTGIVTGSGGGGGNSLCNGTQWDVAATVSDTAVTASRTTLHQGIAVRVPYGTACPS